MITQICRWVGVFGCATSLSLSVAAAGGLPKTFRDYRNWKAAAPEPVLMAAALSRLCAPPNLDGEGDNPHEPSYAQAYVNHVGEGEFFGKLHPVFPKGTVLVKEKLGARDASSLKLMTVMIKREAGYSPKHGDWEYLVVDGRSNTVSSRGKLTHCMNCHETRSADDFVFRDVVPSSRRSQWN